jgi:hypothetical protein
LPPDFPGPEHNQPRRTHSAAAPKHSILGKVLNGFMIGSVLLLFALVLLQQKRYADGDAGTVADAFILKVQTAIANDRADGDTVAPN